MSIHSDCMLCDHDKLRERAEAAERELTIVESVSQRNADAHMAEMKLRRAAEAKIAKVRAELTKHIEACEAEGDRQSTQIGNPYGLRGVSQSVCEG